VTDETPSINIRADELRTVREAMRDLGSLLTELEDGDVEKLVLTQRNRMRAVVVSLEHWSKVQRALAGRGAVESLVVPPIEPPTPPTRSPASSATSAPVPRSR
jgi:hypothetical protein